MQYDHIIIGGEVYENEEVNTVSFRNTLSYPGVSVSYEISNISNVGVRIMKEKKDMFSRTTWTMGDSRFCWIISDYKQAFDFMSIVYNAENRIFVCGDEPVPIISDDVLLQHYKETDQTSIVPSTTHAYGDLLYCICLNDRKYYFYTDEKCKEFTDSIFLRYETLIHRTWTIVQNGLAIYGKFKTSADKGFVPMNISIPNVFSVNPPDKEYSIELSTTRKDIWLSFGSYNTAKDFFDTVTDLMQKFALGKE